MVLKMEEVVIFCDSNTAAKILGCSDRTLFRYRQEGKLIEGIHWGRNPSGKVLYNSVLLNQLIRCGGKVNHPDHQKFIQRYLESLPENQPMKRGKKAATNQAVVVG